MKEIQLHIAKQAPKIAIVAGEFNRLVTDLLLEGALAALREKGVEDSDILVAWVPGAFELPLAAEWMLSGGHADAVLALGAVIRGETAHFDYVAGECARGLAEVSLRHRKPVILGVLTTENLEQALIRASSDQDNKGYDCALATLQMLGLIEALESEGKES